MEINADIFAGMFGFEKKAYFEAEEGSEKAPKVEFWKEATAFLVR